MLSKRTVIVLASMLTSFSAWSQLSNLNGSSEAGLPGVVMPSPENATLTRKITENIDLYTGRLNVEIPLYTFKSRHIEVPISLQATANALNMNDPGGFVGMGWFLNAGGVITRVMRNLPDEVNGAYTFYDPVQEGNRTITAYGYFQAANLNYDPKRFRPLMPSASLAQEYNAGESVDIINMAAWDTRINRVNHGLDLEPDEFYFNFGKYNGKFVINQQKQVVPIIGGQLTFVPIISNNKITGFTVTTDDGFVYEFGDYTKNAVEETKFSSFSKSTLLAYKYTCKGTKTERIEGEDVLFTVYFYVADPVVPSMEGRAFTKNETEYYPGELMFNSDEDNHSYSEYPAYSSSWYLTSIKSPNSDTVNFVYDDNGTLTYTESSVITSTKLIDQGFNAKLDCTPGPPWEKPSEFTSFTPPIQDPRELYFVHPSYCDQTETINTIALNAKKLKEINSSQGYKVQFFRNTPRPEMPGDKRLDKITVTYNGQLIKNYSFNYEIVRSSSPQEYYTLKHYVPKRVYNQTFVRSELSDVRWSGFEKKLEESMRHRMYLTLIQEEGANGELVPPYKIDYFSKELLPHRTTLHQDKYGYHNNYGVPTPDLGKLQAGVLKKITYPTGGFKEFEFEVSGNGTYWNGLRIKTVRESASATESPILTNYTYGTFAVSDRVFTSYWMYDRFFELFVTALNKIVRKTDFKEFNSTRRANSEASTRGAAGGYTFVETSQPGNGSKRIEFTTANDLNSSDPLTHTYVATNYTTLGIHDIGNAFPYPPYNSIDWKRGLPKDRPRYR